MRILQTGFVVAIGVAIVLLESADGFGQQQGGRANGQPFGPQRVAAGNPRQPAAPQPPFGPLTPEELKQLDDILNFWQQETAKIQRYRCKFRRWEYDPNFGPKDRDIARTYAEGVIKYAQPDKGLYRVEFLGHYTPPQEPGGKPQYVKQPGINGEHWICDGQSVFMFDYVKKQLIQQQLPPDMQGKAIADGPLPFIFGADKNKMAAKYWLRTLPPQRQGEYWLEALPKEKGAGFHAVHIILAEEDFLPKAMTMYPPGYHPVTNPSRTMFVFENRETNWNQLPERLNLWHREFFAPATPSGWERVDRPFNERPGAAPVADNAPPAPQKKSSFFDPLGRVFGRK